MTAPLPLGTAVEFTYTLHRKRIYPEKGYGRWRAVWTHEAYPGEREPAPRDGVVVGVRSLRNGNVQSYGHYEPLSFYGDETVTAYLIAFDVRRSPVFVLPGHLAVKAAA